MKDNPQPCFVLETNLQNSLPSEGEVEQYYRPSIFSIKKSKYLRPKGDNCVINSHVLFFFFFEIKVECFEHFVKLKYNLRFLFVKL